MAQTSVEKILSAHTQAPVTPGEIVFVPVDGTMSPDAGAPFSIQTFFEMGGEHLWDPDRVTLVIDHASPAPNERISKLHQMMRSFASKMGCRLFDIGQGICHQLVIENRLVKPGDIFIGGDSHTPTYGALGAFAMGVGATDIAAVWLTGETWLRVPSSVKVILTGGLQPGVFPKDIILALMKQIDLSGSPFSVIEFHGPGLDQFNQSDRITLANMTPETGAKSALIVSPDHPEFHPDPGAVYQSSYTLDLHDLSPQVSQPHHPANVCPLSDLPPTPVNMAFIGTCTNGNLQDLHAAAQVLKGERIARGVRLLVIPASHSIFTQAVKDGTAAILMEAGAIFGTPGCGPCAGTHQGIPGDGEVVISSGNRNFPGRMGNRQAKVYLASPAVVAASALAGEITDPRPFFEYASAGT